MGSHHCLNREITEQHDEKDRGSGGQPAVDRGLKSSAGRDLTNKCQRSYQGAELNR